MIQEYLQYLQEKTIRFNIKTGAVPIHVLRKPMVLGGKHNKADLRDGEAIGAAIWNKDRSKLIVLEHVKYNIWTIPVGKVDPGQTVEQGLKMELSEELGIIPLKYKKLGSYPMTFLKDGYKVKQTTHIFDILSYKGIPKNKEPHKHSNMKWVTIDELRKLKPSSLSNKWYLESYDKEYK